jgi:5-methylcytosine-specific restriction endonuclease McrA
LSKHARLYAKASWKHRRAAQLREHPLCAYCLKRGQVVAASVADHIEPHDGDAEKFEGPLQSLCATCHSAIKQAEENGGLMRGCGLDGMPLDPRHPWNLERKHRGGD